jgi:hypothetical protein
MDGKLLTDYYAYASFSTALGFLPHPITARKLVLFGLAHSAALAGDKFRKLEAAHSPQVRNLVRLESVSLEALLDSVEKAQALAMPAWRVNDREWGLDVQQWRIWKKELLK